MIPRTIKGRNVVFILTCSVCSKDTELWPYGSITSYKSGLKRGDCPCGCGKHPYWTRDQWVIRIKRECAIHNYKFNGFVEFKGVFSKLCLENLLTGHKWDTTKANDFFNGHGDPIEGAKLTTLSVTKPDASHIGEFYKAGFSAENMFKRNLELEDNNGTHSFFDYLCPVCSFDEYVEAGLCSGIFSTRQSDLKKGHSSCRCTSKYRWTRPLREYQIRKLCLEGESTFLCWKYSENSFNIDSVFYWRCKKGHLCETTVNNFVNSGRRCKTCSDLAADWGYYPDRVNEADNLYLLLFKSKYETFIKVGRSFDVANRIKDFLKYYDVEVLTTYQSNHQTIYDTEQDIHSYLSQYHYTPSINFGGSVKECFKIEALDKAEDIFYDLSLPIGLLD